MALTFSSYRLTERQELLKLRCILDHEYEVRIDKSSQGCYAFCLSCWLSMTCKVDGLLEELIESPLQFEWV